MLPLLQCQNPFAHLSSDKLGSSPGRAAAASPSCRTATGRRAVPALAPFSALPFAMPMGNQKLVLGFVNLRIALYPYKRIETFIYQ